MSTVSSVIERKKQQIQELENKNNKLLEENCHFTLEWMAVRDNILDLKSEISHLEMQKSRKIKIPKLNLKDLGSIFLTGILMMTSSMAVCLIFLGALNFGSIVPFTVAALIVGTIGSIGRNFKEEKKINVQREDIINEEINDKQLEITDGENQIAIFKQNMTTIEKEYRSNRSDIALIQKDISKFLQTDIMGYNIGSQQNSFSDVDAPDKVNVVKKLGSI